MIEDANLGASNPAQANAPASVPAQPQIADQSRTSWQASQTRPATMSLTGAVDTLTDRKPILVSHQYSSACLQELQYVGHLVRRARQPLCAINGVLSLIQLESIHSTQTELEELQRAIRADLETIRFAFQLKVPVSALVVGLEKERDHARRARTGDESTFRPPL
jgi:hypothetical protein